MAARRNSVSRSTLLSPAKQPQPGTQVRTLHRNPTSLHPSRSHQPHRIQTSTQETTGLSTRSDSHCHSSGPRTAAAERETADTRDWTCLQPAQTTLGKRGIVTIVATKELDLPTCAKTRRPLWKQRRPSICNGDMYRKNTVDSTTNTVRTNDGRKLTPPPNEHVKALQHVRRRRQWLSSRRTAAEPGELKLAVTNVCQVGRDCVVELAPDTVLQHASESQHRWKTIWLQTHSQRYPPRCLEKNK